MWKWREARNIVVIGWHLWSGCFAPGTVMGFHMFISFKPPNNRMREVSAIIFQKAPERAWGHRWSKWLRAQHAYLSPPSSSRVDASQHWCLHWLSKFYSLVKHRIIWVVLDFSWPALHTLKISLEWTAFWQWVNKWDLIVNLPRCGDVLGLSTISPWFRIRWSPNYLVCFSNFFFSC